MKRLLDNSVTLFVIVIVLLLIIPLSPFMLDVMIILNLSISMMILIITMNIKEPLEFSIFPSLLLVTTLFRLGINVSSTRNILTKSGQAGKVIQSFGDFVLQGNVVVGLIIFLIIMLVQFLVITKGAERVAEVAARFTLDAMPGKQMAIDADLNSGLIDEQQAKERRRKIQREADFFGAMDGATKIVKGDAIVSLVITAINLIGGIVIGMVTMGIPLNEVAHIYTIASVGDGLVSQLPALMISTGTGMIVTRAVSEGTLNTDVSRQFLAQPKAIVFAGGAMLFLTLVPGMPKLQMIIIGVVLVAAGLRLGRSIKEAAEAQQAKNLMAIGGAEGTEAGMEPASEEEFFKDINNVYSVIEVEPVEMEVGYSLIPLVDESSGGKMLKRIIIFRRQYAQDMGFVVPSVRLRDSSGMNTNQYIIKIKGEEVARGEILVDHYLALEPSSPAGEIDGIETIEPAYGIPSKWILPENKEMAEIYGYTVIDPLSVMITHLSETVKKHAHELLSRQEVVTLIENLKTTAPELVSETVPDIISYGNLQKILVSLLKENIPVKDLETILEVSADQMLSGADITRTVEEIRDTLKRTITRKFCTGGQMRVITLDAGLEQKMVESMSRSDQGVYFALEPDIMQNVINNISEEMKKFSDLSQPPVVLTSQVLRIHVYRMLEPFFPNINVLSFNEVTSNVQLQAIGNITA